MKHIILYSGGLGSFGAACWIKHKYPNDEILLYFNDTKTEDDDLYRFIDKTVSFLGCELINDSDGRDIWEVFEDERFIGNSRIDVCSRVLKRERAQKFIKQFNTDEVDVSIGIDWTEIHRYERAKPNWEPYKLRAPLIEAALEEGIDKTSFINSILNSAGIRKPRLYDLGFPHNNCGGMCVKAGLSQFALLYEKLPLVYLYHEKRQEDIMSRNPKLKPFLKKTIKGKTYYLTMRQYRLLYLKDEQHIKQEIEEFDYGGCACAI